LGVVGFSGCLEQMEKKGILWKKRMILWAVILGKLFKNFLEKPLTGFYG
jgi:hypothetical protein